MIIYLLVLIGYLVVIIVNYAKAYHPPKEVISMRSGTVGSGKTLTSVLALKFHYWVLNIRHFFFRKKWPEPVVWSNIPLRLSKKVYANVLTREHLLLQDPLPVDKCNLILIDEAGTSFSQFDYDDKNIMPENYLECYQTLEVFCRFFRHFYGKSNKDNCRIYLTDQSSSEITVNMRRRISTCLLLSGFHRCWLFFYKVNVQLLQVNADEITNMTNIDDDDSLYLFGFLPFRSKAFSFYDSHSYADVLIHGFVNTLPFTNWKDNPDGLRSNYLVDLRMTQKEKAEYKARIKHIQKQADLNYKAV